MFASTRMFLLIMAVFSAFALPFATLAASEGANEDLHLAARRFVELWSSGAYEGATGTFDNTMSEKMPAAKLQETWAALSAQVGGFRGITGTRAEESNGHDIVHVTCRFESASIDFRIVYDSERRIAGLWLTPAAQEDAGPPPYADPAAFDEVSVKVGTQEWELPGTLSIPAGRGPHPAVVLVHGSGPNDRDGTVGPLRPLRDIAWGLASSGIAVLRYDKRTMVHASRMAAIRNELTVREETIDDALAAVLLLRATERIDPRRIFVLGHSLGGMLAPRIAAAAASSGEDAAAGGGAPAPLAGIIILAGAARPLENLLVEQYRYLFSLDGVISDQEREELDRLEAQAARVKDPALATATPAEELPFGVAATYWLDLRAYDPAEAAAALDLPILILQGERDYQVSLEDFRIWQAALSGAPRAELRSYPALNHLFVAGEGITTPAEYLRAGHVAGEVIEDMARWIGRH